MAGNVKKSVVTITRGTTANVTFYNPTPSTKPITPGPPCRDIYCPATGMVNFTSLQCKNQTGPSCNHPLTPVFDDRECCFLLTCPRCVAPDGRYYEAGNKWNYNCRLCVCMQDSSIVCSPIICVSPTKPPCTTPGSQLVAVQTTDGTCCPNYQCVCRLPSNCSPIKDNCTPGFQPKISTKDCCPTIDCEPKGVCVKEGTEYLPGFPIYLPPSSCHECNCTNVFNSTTKLNEIYCNAIICNTTCELGEVYTVIPGQCCGKCVPNGCVVTLSTGEKRVLNDAEGVIDDYCRTYTCTQVNGRFITTLTQGNCTEKSTKDCGPGQEFVKSPGECCGKCIQKNCTVTLKNGTVIILAEGEALISPDDICTKYFCKKSLGNIVVTEIQISCAEQSQSDCEKGQEFVKLPGRKCCGKCIQKNCVVITANGTVITLEEGQTITSPDDVCTKYNCKQLLGQPLLNEVQTSCAEQSQLDCEKGQEFVKLPGKCCGKCMQKNCVVITANGTVITLEEGQTILSPDDICTKYNCKKSLGQPVLAEVQTFCAEKSQSDCEKDQVFVKLQGECCGKCIRKNCTVTTANGTVITLEEGQTIVSPDDICTKYNCKKSLGQLGIVEIQTICAYQSQSDCGKGYQYQTIPNQCCGQCVQTSCVYVGPNGEIELLNKGEIFKSDDGCTTVTCEMKGGLLVASSVTTSCTITSAKDCKLGYTYQAVPKQCCGTCVQTECVFTTASGELQTLKNGQSLPDPSDICTFYNCKETNGQYTASKVTKTCEHKSALDCHDGEEYQKAPDQCCGQCVQTNCLIIGVDGVNKTLAVGDTYTSKTNPCKSYGCIKSSGQIYSVLIDKTCAAVNTSDCESGTVVLSEDGCCQICKAPKVCGLVHNIRVLNIKGCQLKEDVPYCAGVCINVGTTESLPSNNNWPNKAKKCICCDTLKSSIKKVKLKCADGTTFNYEYKRIDKCGCNTLNCQ